MNQINDCIFDKSDQNYLRERNDLFHLVLMCYRVLRATLTNPFVKNDLTILTLAADSV